MDKLELDEDRRILVQAARMAIRAATAVPVFTQNGRAVADRVKKALNFNNLRFVLPGRRLDVVGTTGNGFMEIRLHLRAGGFGSKVEEIIIREPYKDGLDPKHFPVTKEDWTSDSFFSDLLLFSKGQYGSWLTLDGVAVLYIHHYAHAASLKFDEETFFKIFPVVDRDMEKFGFALDHMDRIELLRRVSRQNFESAMSLPVGELITMPVARVNNVPAMWTPNPIVQEKLLAAGAVKEPQSQ
ncbi:hypothetical protein Xoosp14_35 [Xanthomonas phage Xoo-sp14]|nr:hypothetical protein Xoosp14_35 [Xanthomonas phage Xoo-sp14]